MFTKKALKAKEDGDRAGQGIGARQASGVGAASLLAALSGFVVLFITARVLTKAENAEFLAYWAALFAVYGVLYGVVAETTRGVGTVAAGERRGSSKGASVLLAGLMVGTLLAIPVLAVGLPFARRFFGTEYGVPLVLLLAFTCIVYSAQAALAGSLQGRGLWGPYTRLLTLEAVFRLAAVLVTALVSGTLFGLEIAALAALLSWPVVLLTSRQARGVLGARADIPLVPFLRQTGQALISAAASAALLVSFPLLIKATTSAEDYALAAPLLLAISLTRAPIMLPLGAFQGVAITAVIQSPDKGIKALWRPIVAVMGVGLVGALLAALVGPWIMLFFGPDYNVQRWVLAGLTLSAALIALLTLTGTVLLAVGKHKSYAIGWVVATVAAFLCLLLPFSTDVRCVLALFVGPLLGIAVHAAALPGTGSGARA